MTASVSETAALLQQALASHKAGDIEAAVASYRAVLAVAPREALALAMMGVIAQQRGNTDLALRLSEAALGAKPDLAVAWHNRGVVLRALKRFDEALASAARALAVDISYAGAWSLQGLLLIDQRRTEDGLRSLAHAAALEPHQAEFHADYAFGLLTAQDLPGAYAAMRRALALDPAINPLTMGNILKQAGYPLRAIPYFEQAAIQLPALRGSANEAMARLQIGDFTAGWPLWEQRQLGAEWHAGLPYWQGEPVESLLLYEDQGLGDALQCIRYLPHLRARTNRIVLQAGAPLSRLFTTAFPDVTVIGPEDAVPPVDARLRLLSLPALFGTSFDRPPPAAPYLTALEEWRSPWRKRLAPMPHPRIGLVWAGNPKHPNDHNRSLSMQQLTPLLKVASPYLVSLQRGVTAPPLVMDATRNLTDCAAMAGLLAELDLLITVDTAPAHLAGALGIPVWLLLPSDPDWRWLLGREESMWYRTMRLYRQTKPRDWDGVLARVASDLRRLIAGDRSVLAPPEAGGSAMQRDPQAIPLPEA